MVDLSYFHGVKVEESADTPSLMRLNNYGATFVNGTAPDADAAAFPLGLSLVKSLTQAAALGAAGTLLDDLAHVFGEGGSVAIVNRVEHSTDPATLEANLIGNAAARTGIYAALRCKALFKIKPRVLITGGNTGTWIDDGVVSVNVTAGGSGYVSAPTVTPSGGGSDPGKVLPALEAVLGEGANAGKVVAVKVVTPGKNMSAALALAFSGGGGTGAAATANVGDVGNPLNSALNAVANEIGARAYVDGPNTTDAEAVRWRQTLGSRIMGIDPKGLVNVAGTPVAVRAAPVFAGVRARVVASNEGVSGSVSNKEIRTLDGAARTIVYPVDSNYLNGNQVSTIINEGGLRTWGSRLAASEALWQFDSVRAVGDMINDDIESIYFQWVDKGFKAHNLKMMIEDGNAMMRVRALNGDILGGRVWLSDLNVPTLNAQGKVFINGEFEPVVPMEQIHVTTYRNILYFQLTLDQVRGAIENGPLTLAA